jgi:uncharacterized membrane protein
VVGRQSRYAVADTFQQAVGGFLIAGPFVVTQEVWDLAVNMAWYQAAVTAFLVLIIGYAALYRADDNRDPDREAEVGGVPLRFLSLISVSYLSVLVLALAFDAPGTFLGGQFAGDVRGLAWVTLKAVSVGSVFSVIGAATADSLF